MNQDAETASQYKDASNLRKRMALFKFGSGNASDLWTGVLEQYDIGTRRRILEVGCGDGTMWAGRSDLLATDSDVYLSDISPGMLADAEAKLGNHPRFEYLLTDAESLPFVDNAFDAVMAHFMAYHLASPEDALAESCRVTRSDGVVGLLLPIEGSMSEIYALAHRIDARVPEKGRMQDMFGDRDAKTATAKHFSRVERKAFSNVLRVTSVDALVDYAGSYSIAPGVTLEAHFFESFAMAAGAVIDREGAFNITSGSVLYLCYP